MRWITPDDLSRPGDLPFVVLAQMIGDSAFASSHRIVSKYGSAEYLATFSDR
jgi:hypothetical protein